MKPCLVRNISHLAYLEPPHLHDPTSVSDVASLPAVILDTLPEAVQSALYNLQQSTSIVYASFVRLQDLLQERFERLMPSIEPDGEISFSESSFFNYVNSLCAERTYLLSDAHPDWRHKNSLAQVAIQPYHNLLVNLEPSYLVSSHSVLEWWEDLQSAVASWCEYARVVHVPDYEDTVGEYLTLRKNTPALAIDLGESPMETLVVPTPTFEKDSEPLHLCQIKERDFASPLLPEDEASPKALGLGLTGVAGIGKLASTITQEVLMRDDSPREDRKDSGVGLS